MEIGGLIMRSFGLVFGNPDIMVGLLSFAVAVSLVLIIKEIYQKYVWFGGGLM